MVWHGGASPCYIPEVDKPDTEQHALGVSHLAFLKRISFTGTFPFPATYYPRKMAPTINHHRQALTIEAGACVDPEGRPPAKGLSGLPLLKLALQGLLGPIWVGLFGNILQEMKPVREG